MTSRKSKVRVTVAPVITTVDLARIMAGFWNDERLNDDQRAALDMLAVQIERRIPSFGAFFEQTWEDLAAADLDERRREAEELEKR